MLSCAISNASTLTTPALSSVYNWTTPFVMNATVPSTLNTATVTVQNTGSCNVDVMGNGGQIDAQCATLAPGNICSFYFLQSAGTVAIKIAEIFTNGDACADAGQESAGTIEVDYSSFNAPSIKNTVLLRQ